ncbi:MAG: transglutaminase-like domain-containing protein [Fusobacteriota bacterium]
MKKSNFLLGASLIFWGAVSGELLLGIGLGLLMEASYYLTKKVEFSKDDFFKISDLNSIIFLASIMIIYFNVETKEILFTLGKWMPLIFSLIMLAQLYSTSDKIIIGTKLGKKYKHHPMDLRLPYLMITLFSTAVVNSDFKYYFMILFILITWSLFLISNDRYSKKVKILLVIIIFFGSNYLQNSTEKFSEYIKYSILKKYRRNWIAKIIKSRMKQGSYGEMTSIGELGELKLSGEILMRVKSVDYKNKNIPRLLRDNIYNLFTPPNWHKQNKKFEVADLDDKDNWVLNNFKPKKLSLLEVDQKIKNDRALLSLPKGSYRAKNLNGYLETDKYRAFRISETGGQINYRVSFDSRQRYNFKVERGDLQIPSQEKEALSKVADKLDLYDKNENEILKTLIRYFDKNFEYSLKIQNTRRSKSYLKEFLLEHKSGHCEYFATATVLLLREAGIPSRYITGFVVEEKSKYDDNYIIRERHGHSWTLAYINNDWIEIDTTPGNWLSEDEEGASRFEEVSDFFDSLTYKIRMFLKENDENVNLYLTIITSLLLAIMILRIYLRQRKKLKDIGKNKYQRKKFKTIESDINLIKTELKKFDIPKLDHETLNMWINRIIIIKKDSNENKNIISELENLEEIIKLYTKIRFDFKHTKDKDLLILNKKINKWLFTHKNKMDLN